MNFTASSIITGMQCPKLYRYKYVDGYKSKLTGPIRVGILVHVGLEEYWLGNSLEESLAEMHNVVSGVGPGNSKDDWWDSDDGQIAYEKCRAYIRGYYKKYTGDDGWAKDPIKCFGKNPITIFTEKEFEYISNGVKYRGKMDVLIVDYKLGQVTVIEHKTTSSDIAIGGNYFRRLPVDIQLTIYREAATRFLRENTGWERTEAYPVPIVIYDVIQTTKASPRQKTKKEGGSPVTRRKGENDDQVKARKLFNLETLEEFSERMSREYEEDLHPSKYARQEVMCTSAQHEIKLIELEEYGKLLLNRDFLEIRNSTSCGNFGGCAFLDVCLGVTPLEGMLSLERSEDFHPELEGKAPRWISYNQ
tara:strand:- start:738 stop:1820 length:1083 start_codon:yes stop_codon:yes gene_type:complete